MVGSKHKSFQRNIIIMESKYNLVGKDVRDIIDGYLQDLYKMDHRVAFRPTLQLIRLIQKSYSWVTDYRGDRWYLVGVEWRGYKSPSSRGLEYIVDTNFFHDILPNIERRIGDETWCN